MNARTNDKETHVISVTWGSQTFGRRKTDVRAFHYGMDGLTKFVNKRLNKMSPPRAIVASTDGYAGHGHWYAESLYAEQDVLLLLRVNDSAHGALNAQAGVFVELDSDGPLIQVGVQTCPHRLAVIDHVSAFLGRGHVLSPDEVKARGYDVPSHLIKNYFNQEEIDELITLSTMSPGAPKREPVTVETVTGETTTVLLAKEPRRKIRIRR